MSIALSDVVSLADLTALGFDLRGPGYARAPLHEDGAMRASVLRIQPCSGVPAHKHSCSHDLFIGIRGELEIRCDGARSVLQPGGFCRVPPGVRHEVWNGSAVQEAFCVLIHSDPVQFDFIEASRG